MHVQLANTDKEVFSCFPVVQQLRENVLPTEFLSRIREQEKHGYRMAMLSDNGEVMAVAGFRIGSNLAWGRYLYVDDLVVDAENRSKGYGSVLLDWLRGFAVESSCVQLHLDSGMSRTEAHRFYHREGMTSAGFHFSQKL